MSNGTRHLLGVLTGIVAIPVVSALAFGGLTLQLRAYAQFLTRGAQLYSSVAVLAVGAILVALLVGTRISPLASLIPGLAYTAGGVLVVAIPRTIIGLANDLPEGRLTLGPLPPASLSEVVGNGLTSGACLLVGLVLLIASLPPARWRGTARTRLATSAGLHRADPDAEEPRLPPLPPERPEPGDPRGPGLPSDETASLPQQPYGSGPQRPYDGTRPDEAYGGYGGSGPQAPYGGSGPQAPYGGSGPQAPYGGSGPQAPFGGARQEQPLSAPWPEEPYGRPEPRNPLDVSEPQGAYGSAPSAYGDPRQSPYDSGPRAPYGGADPGGLGGGPGGPGVGGGAGGGPQDPYRASYEPPARPRPEDDPAGYAPGYRPSSWSGPQAPFPPGEAGRPARPGGDDPYATPGPPRYAPPPAEPWGPAPETDPAPVRDFFNDPNAGSGRTAPPGSNADDTTGRMPWTEDDRSRFRDPRDPYDR